MKGITKVHTKFIHLSYFHVCSMTRLISEVLIDKFAHKLFCYSICFLGLSLSSLFYMIFYILFRVVGSFGEGYFAAEILITGIFRSEIFTERSFRPAKFSPRGIF